MTENNRQDTWTAADEAALNEMAARREAVMEKRRAAVGAVVDAFYYGGIGSVDIVDGLIEHADAVRDALKPYDSGARAA